MEDLLTLRTNERKVWETAKRSLSQVIQICLTHYSSKSYRKHAESKVKASVKDLTSKVLLFAFVLRPSFNPHLPDLGQYFSRSLSISPFSCRSRILQKKK